MPAPGETTRNPLSLGTDTFPSVEAINTGYITAVTTASNAHESAVHDVDTAFKVTGGVPTVLTKPLRRYLEVVQMYPYDYTLDEFQEIGEAATVGDPLAQSLEWWALTYEVQYQDALPEKDDSEARDDTIAEINRQEEMKRKYEAQKGPTAFKALVEEADESIAIIEGAIAVAKMKMAEPAETNSEAE